MHEFSELFKAELGYLKNSISSEIQTTFCKSKPVPVPILEDLNEAYDAGIKEFDNG